MTSLTTNQQTIQDLYGTHLGRKAASEGLDYWSSQLDAGKSVADVIRGIQSGSEWTKRKDYLEANPNATESELDANISPGGGTYYKDGQVTGVRFDPNNTWSSPLMTSGNNTFTDELAAINQELGITGMDTFSDTVEGTGTAAAANTGNYQVGVTHDAAGNPITSTPPGTPPGTGSNYLTSDDLTSWWEGLDKPWLDQTNTSGGMDDFMKFMMFMSMMRPQGGGYGSSQYGYGGLNPGGVQSAYNPMSDIQSAISAFQTIPGIGTNLTNTGTTP